MISVYCGAGLVRKKKTVIVYNPVRVRPSETLSIFSALTLLLYPHLYLTRSQQNIFAPMDQINCMNRRHVHKSLSCLCRR